MKTLLVPCLVALMTLGTVGVVAAGTPGPSPEPDLSPGVIEEPVYVDTTDILLLESFPVQVQLQVSGSLPTPCHSPDWTVWYGEDAIEVRLWSVADTGLCAAVLEPFDISIPLGAFETVSLPVVLNGEGVGRVHIGAEPGTGASLLGAGWSFGMCMGYCRADLTVGSDGHLILAASDPAGTVTLFTNAGSLTAAGSERLAAAVAALANVPLQEVYGCPDCADGGAAYLRLEQGGRVSDHTMEFGAPPAELAELYAMTTAIIGALEACLSNDLVTVAEDCEVWLPAA
jgi:hypothetical protein